MTSLAAESQRAPPAVAASKNGDELKRLQIKLRHVTKRFALFSLLK